jgi:two-component system OmpR family sensor kinase
MVFADPLRLHQVVVNLLSNARSHTPPGSRVDVRVIVDRVTSRAIVEVTDNGPGIPPNLLPHVFERFVRGDAQRVRGGTGDGGSGLGLPIAAALMHAFGGDIHASGGPEGATITLELRLV